MAWKMVVAVRCSQCDVFTPSDEIFHAPDGEPYCERCEAPAPARKRPKAFVVAAAACAAVVASMFVAACASQL